MFLEALILKEAKVKAKDEELPRTCSWKLFSGLHSRELNALVLSYSQPLREVHNRLLFKRPWCGCKCLLPKATIRRFEFKIQYNQMGRKIPGPSFYKVDLWPNGHWA